MKIKYSFALLLLALLWAGGMNVQSQTVSLDIKKWDTSDKSIDLNNIRKITFGGGNLILSYHVGSDENIVTSSIRNMVFTSITGINDLKIDAKSILVYPNPGIDFISLKNVPTGDLNLVIYSICGNQIMNVQHYTINDQVNISRLTKGIYIIKVNNQALKFTKL